MRLRIAELLSALAISSLFLSTAISGVVKRNVLILFAFIAIIIIFPCYLNGVSLAPILIVLAIVLAGLGLPIFFENKRDLIKLIAVFGIVALLMNLLFSLAVPNFGRMTGIHEGSWQGLYDHKNRLGGVSGFFIVFYGLYLKNLKKLSYIGLILSIALAIGSRSSTAIVVPVAVFSIYVAFTRMQAIRFRIPFIASILLLLYSVINVSSESLLNSTDILGKDSSLTGRIPLWSAIFENDQIRLLGYGINNYWGNEYQSAYFKSVIGWSPFYSHNGYIEILLSLGWILGGVLILILVYLFIDKIIFQRPIAENYLFLFFVIYNFSESTYIQYDNPLMVLFIILIGLYLKEPSRPIEIGVAHTKVISPSRRVS